MKHNWKKRPKFIFPKQWHSVYSEKVQEFDEDFERELRDLLSDADAFITEKQLWKANDIFQHPTNKNATIHILDGKFTVMIDVKDVLGEK